MWILAKTKGNQEARAEKNLINQGFKCLLPYLKTKKFIHNRWVQSKEVMFSGYIFIDISKSDKNVHKINNTYGVSKLLINRDTGIPYILEDKYIDEIHKQFMKNNDVHNMNAGDSVVITQGKLSRFSGIFLEKCSKYRAKLLVSILSRKQEILVSMDDIQKVYA